MVDSTVPVQLNIASCFEVSATDQVMYNDTKLFSGLLHFLNKEIGWILSGNTLNRPDECDPA